MSTASMRNERLTWIGGVGALIAASAFASLGLPWGLSIGAIIVLGWALLPAIYLVALAHVLLPIAVDPMPTLLWLASLELGLVLVLLGSATTRSTDQIALYSLRVGSAGLVLAGAVGLGMQIDGQWAPIGLLLCGFTVLAYVLHRYEQLQLGLLGGSQ